MESVFGARFINTEVPIDVAPEDNPTSEPEPDIIVLTRDTVEFKGTTNPSPADLRVVIEVSVMTLAFDLTTKAQLYARAGIQDYWILDVEGRRMIVHRLPSQGRYESVIAYNEDEPVAPLDAPIAKLRVVDLLY